MVDGVWGGQDDCTSLWCSLWEGGSGQPTELQLQAQLLQMAGVQDKVLAREGDN